MQLCSLPQLAAACRQVQAASWPSPPLKQRAQHPRTVHRFIQNSWDVHFLAPTLGASLDMNSAWNYLKNNGPTTIFQGYAW